MQQKCTHIGPEKLAWHPRKFWAASGPAKYYEEIFRSNLIKDTNVLMK